MIGTIDYDINNPPENLKTQFGNARITPNGYYKITSRKEGNHNKILHRLIFEEYYNIDILEEFPNQKMTIHHIDGNRANNNIWNLDIIENGEHTSLHHLGKRGNLHQEHSKQKMSKSKNTTGFFRVVKEKCKATQGFRWAYQYYSTPNKRKTIASVNLIELMKKVMLEEADWIIIDEENARRTCEEYGYNYDILKMEAN